MDDVPLAVHLRVLQSARVSEFQRLAHKLFIQRPCFGQTFIECLAPSWKNMIALVEGLGMGKGAPNGFHSDAEIN